MSHDELPLFAWASSRPTAVVIDGRAAFQRRTNEFVRQLIIGYRFATEGGADAIDINTERARRAAEAGVVLVEEGRESA